MVTFTDYLPVIKQKLRIEKKNEIMKSVRREQDWSFSKTNEQIEADPKKRNVLDVSLGADGGLRTYLEGSKEPIRIYPDQNTIFIISIIKRLLPLIAESIKKQNFWQRIITVLAVRYNFNILPDWFDYLFRFNAILLKDENWSQPVKEIRRVMKSKVNDNILDFVSLVIEFDSAYRYRFQDIVSLLDKTKLTNRKSTIKEISRLFDELHKREDWGKVPKYMNIKKLVVLILLSPKIRNQTINILKELNLDEIKLSKEDIYWTNEIEGYLYRGLPYQQRRSENIISGGQI